MNREGKHYFEYTRVSTEMQVEGYSLEGQENCIKKYADREEMICVGKYKDAGKSGKSIEGRPDFRRMLKDIQNGTEVDFVIVYKLSRFGRNAADILNALMRILKDEELLISSNDMFIPGKSYKKSFLKKFKWDIPGNNLFDDCLKNINEELFNKRIQAVSFNGLDLIINLGDDIKIQVLTCTLQQGEEVFRIFKKGDINSHIVVEM